MLPRRPLKHVRRMRVPNIRRMYYYIIAVVQGKRFIADVPGGPVNMDDARHKASAFAYKSEELRNNRWEVIEHKSSNIDFVRHNLQHRLWEGTAPAVFGKEATGSFIEATKRMRHKIR